MARKPPKLTKRQLAKSKKAAINKRKARELAKAERLKKQNAKLRYQLKESRKREKKTKSELRSTKRALKVVKSKLQKKKITKKPERIVPTVKRTSRKLKRQGKLAYRVVKELTKPVKISKREEKAASKFTSKSPSLTELASYTTPLKIAMYIEANGDALNKKYHGFRVMISYSYKNSKFRNHRQDIIYNLTDINELGKMLRVYRERGIAREITKIYIQSTRMFG